MTGGELFTLLRAKKKSGDRPTKNTRQDKWEVKTLGAIDIKPVNKPNIAMKLEPSDKDEDGIMSLPYMDVSENSGTPKSSILIGFSIIFTIHFGVPPFSETPIWKIKDFLQCSPLSFWTEARCDPVLMLGKHNV